jgi:hypothetical protein
VSGRRDTRATWSATPTEFAESRTREILANLQRDVAGRKPLGDDGEFDSAQRTDISLWVAYSAVGVIADIVTSRHFRYTPAQQRAGAARVHELVQLLQDVVNWSLPIPQPVERLRGFDACPLAAAELPKYPGPGTRRLAHPSWFCGFDTCATVVAELDRSDG